MQQDPDKRSKVSNLMPFMILIHIVSLAVISMSETRIAKSMHDPNSYLYYFLFSFFGFTTLLYSDCCINPGFVDKEPANIDDKFYCNECKMYIPYRASHCRACKRCVLRRDHHCPYINQCVGRDNHLNFYIWVFFEAIFMGYVLFDLVYSIFTSMPVFLWIRTFGVNLFLIPFVAFDFLQTSLLFISHTLLIVNNSTTWESSRRHTISYLADYPLTFNPFSKSTFENFIEFFTMKKNKMEWDLSKKATIEDFENEQKMFAESFMNGLVKLFV